jgi:RNA polymerase sigma-70 factor (ECF subfamily)
MKGDDANIAEFQALYLEWYVGLVRYLRRLLHDSTGLAEDIAQDAFLIMWRRWPDVRNHPCPRAWLYTVARHLAFDALKERSHEFLRPELPEQASAGEHDPSDGYNERMALHEAVSKLPERQREAVRLFYFHDFPQNEVAAIMQIRRGTVAALLSQARNRLAGLMG